MRQLQINGLDLPETSWDRYRCYENILSQKVEMISGRVTEEIRGKVWKIEYSYDYMGAAEYRRLLNILRGGRLLNVVFLPDNDIIYKTGRFIVESLSPASYAFSRDGVPRWHNFSFVLREERPRD